MSNDVLITPVSRKMDFKDSSGNVDATIETDASGNLIITNSGGDISIGDTTSDIFVGDGTNNIDIIFEQSGEIRGESGVTITLGATGSNVRMATDLNLNSNDITNIANLTATNLTLSSLSAQNSEATAVMINGSGVIGTRELGSNAFNSTTIPSISGLATESYVGTQINNLIDGAPGTLNTLNELAAAVADNNTFFSTVLPKAGGTMTGALVGTTATFFKDATAGTNALNILAVNNGNGTGITFSDNGTPAASASGQNGYLTYYHGDGSSYGSGNAFILSSSETTTTILADGKLMYKEGIYSKPASGTGAGTRKDANWDTAYGWGNHASPGYLTSVPNHSASLITSGTLAAARIPGLAASKITSGTFADARIAASSVTQHTDSKYLRSNAADTATGLITLGNGVIITKASSDQSTSADSASIPSTTGAEVVKFQGGYTNGNYTTEFAKVDRSGNLPLYVRQSLGSSTFSNIARFGNHGQTNGSDVFAVFGGARVDGRVTAQTLTLSSLSAQNSEATSLMINGSGVVGTRELGSNAFNSTTIPTNNNQLTNGAGYITSADGGNATTLDSIDSTGFFRNTQNIGSTSVDNLTTRGVYGNSNESSGQPYDNNAGTIIHLDGRDTTYKSQIFQYSANGAMYLRGKHGGSAAWSSWYQVYDEQHKPTYSELGTMAYSNLTGTPTIPSVSGLAPTASPTFTGDLTIPNKIIHSGDTNTYIQFHSADQFRVVAGGSEVTEWRSDRMQMNNKSITFPAWTNFAETALSGIGYSALNAPIHIASTGVGSTDKYLPFLQGSATHDQGYRTSYVLGGFKQATTGAAWGDGQSGFFMAMGGSDSAPTKEFRFTWDGRIWYTDAGSSTYLDFDTSNKLKFIANGGQRMEITAGGTTFNDNVALGGNQLENIGNAYFNEYLYHNGDTDTYIRIQDNSWTFRTGGDDRLVIDNTNVTVNANLDLKAESDTGANSIHLPRNGMISFYGNANDDHGITSKNQAQNATDDLRFSSYAAMYFNLDANSNNTSTADFVVTRHSHATNKLFQIDGETGAGKGVHSYPNESVDGVSLMSYTDGTVPINSGVVQIRSNGKTGWANGDEMGSVDFYTMDGSGVGQRNIARMVAVNTQGNGSTTTTMNGEIHFYTSTYNAQLNAAPAMRLTENNSVVIGDGTDASSCLKIMPADDATSDDLQFYNGSTRMGEIGTQDTTWLRINQSTAKNIYTPRYIRADNGFFVDGATKGINGSGNFVGGTITGASDANVSNWNTAYTYSQVGHLPLTGGTVSGDVQAAGLYVGSTNTTYDFYNNGTTYLNGATTIDANLQINGNSYANYYDVDAGDGRGLRFWNGSESYKVYMSGSTASGAGRVPGDTTSDYNMYFRMTGGTNRGFTFQKTTGTPHTGIDSTGNIRTIGDIYIGSDSAGDNFLYIDKVTTGTNGIVFRNAGNNKCKILQDSSEFLQFHTNNAQAMEINEAGDVNITKDNAVLKFGSAGTNGVAGCWASMEGNTDTSGEGSGRLFFREHNSTTGSMDAYGMSLGYRGGATTVETAGGNSWTGLSQIGNGQWGMWGHNGDNTGALIMYGDRVGSFVDFASNNIQGITDAYIADQIIHTGDTNTYIQFHAADQWRVVTGGSERLEVNNTATTVTGTFRATGDIVAYYSSDERLKDNITPISNPMEKINKLSGNTFEWNSKQEVYEEGIEDIGVLAQEVEKVLPQVVTTREDGYKAVKYEKIVALLIEGMKEQQEQIEGLQEQIKELKGQI